jgi:Peptide methionine sulfoxide reductase
LPGRKEAIKLSNRHAVKSVPIQPPFAENLEKIIFGLGCFWGAERKFWQLPGVYTTAVGYSAGYTPNPTYLKHNDGSLQRAKGNYDFVVMDGNTFVANKDKGHFNISRGANEVDFAGTLHFGRSDSSRGILKHWDNDSGHYAPYWLDAWQAGFPLEAFKRAH